MTQERFDEIMRELAKLLDQNSTEPGPTLPPRHLAAAMRVLDELRSEIHWAWCRWLLDNEGE